MLDVACGRGRHLHWFANRGHPVTGVDRSVEALQSLAGLAASGPVELVQADIESGQWPLMQGDRPRQFGAVVVTNYLWRALMPVLVDSLAEGGVLLYETFADGNASVGKPSRPDFLLHRGELLHLCRDLRVVAFEDGFCDNPARFVQRIAAVRTHNPDAGAEPEAAGAHVRYVLGSWAAG